MKKIIYLISLTLLFINTACKNVLEVSYKHEIKANNNYFSETDSTDNKNNWSIVFEDKNLKSLINEALANNLSLQKIKQEQELNLADLKFAKGLRLPTIGGVASAGVQNFGEYTMDGVGNFDTNFSPNVRDDQNMPANLPDYQLGLATNWEIDVWGKLNNTKRAAMANFLASTEGYNWAKTTLISNVANSYFELLAAEKKITLLNKTVEIQNQGLAYIKLQKMAGIISELAVDQYEAQMFNFKTQIEEAAIQKIEIQNHLYFLAGTYPKSIGVDNELFSSFTYFKVNTGSPYKLLDNRPDIKEAEWKLKASDADILAAKAAFYPSLNFNGIVGFRSFNVNKFITPEALIFNLFGSLTAPILNRSALNANLMFKKASQKQAFLNYKEVSLIAFYEVYNLSFALERYNKIIDLKQNEVDALTEAQESALQLFKTGRATYLELLYTQKNLLKAELEFIDIQKKLYQTYISLFRALGGVQ